MVELLRKRLKKIAGQVADCRERMKGLSEGDERYDAAWAEATKLLRQSSQLRIALKEAVEQADETDRRDADREFGVVPTGSIAPGTRFRRVHFGTRPTDADRELPSREEVAARDEALRLRYNHGPSALTDADNILAARKYGFERAILWALAYGIQEESFRPEEAMIKLAIAGGSVIGTPASGGYYAPKDSMYGMLQKASTVSPFSGPFEVPRQPVLGDWRSFDNGRAKPINVEAVPTRAVETSEAADGGANTKGALNPSQLELKPTRLQKYYPFSIELEEDDIRDLELDLRNLLGMSFGLAMSEDVTRGAAGGDGREGFVNVTGAAGQTVTSDKAFGSETIEHDDVVDLKYKVGAAYRVGMEGSMAFVFGDDLMAKVEKLKDSDGLPLYQLAVDGLSARLAGVPVWTNTGFEGIAASKIVGACAQWAYLRVHWVNGVQLLTDTFPGSYQRAIYGYLRAASKFILPDAIGLFKTKAT